MERQIRNQLISLLLEKQSTFISGEEMSRRLGCSRAAIWKHIQELRNSGYAIEARPRRGYRLQFRPDRLAPEELYYHLKTKKLGKTIRYFTSVPTTQNVAHQWAKEGAPEGALVVAEEQTAGKGRLGNQWDSPPGQGIWMSLILRPEISIREASHFTLLTSLAVYQAIQPYSRLSVQIKWPNDLLIDGKKVCGILTELKGEEDRIDYLIIGIGVNVNQPADWASEWTKPATSLSQVWGKPIHRASLLVAILQQLEKYYDLYKQEGFAPVKQAWEQITYLFGKRIIARTPNGKVEGVAACLNDDGALVLKTDTGLQELYSAEIESR